MAIIISTDMEGLRGVCRWSQVTPGSPDYSDGCAALRADLRLVLDTLSITDHDLIVVDGHWTGTNLRPHDVAPARLVSGTRMPWGMIEGVQGPNVAGVVLLGYHGCAGSPGAMAHTWGSVLAEVRLDGALIGEVALAALLAADVGVPIIGVSGDDYACAEARKFCGQDVPTAEVKKSLSHESVLFHADADERLEDMARAALERVEKPRERMCSAPRLHEIQVQFSTLAGTERAALMPGSIGTAGRDFTTAARELTFTGSIKDCFDAMRTWALLAESE